MAPSRPSRRGLVLTYGFLAAIALLSAARIVDAGAVPWATIAGSALATALLCGPATWIARDRLPEDRREHLALVAFGVALLLVPIALGASLAFRIPLVRSFDAVIVGGAVGASVALVAERTVIPKRLRGAEL